MRRSLLRAGLLQLACLERLEPWFWPVASGARLQTPGRAET